MGTWKQLRGWKSDQLINSTINYLQRLAEWDKGAEVFLPGCVAHNKRKWPRKIPSEAPLHDDYPELDHSSFRYERG